MDIASAVVSIVAVVGFFAVVALVVVSDSSSVSADWAYGKISSSRAKLKREVERQVEIANRRKARIAAGRRRSWQQRRALYEVEQVLSKSNDAEMLKLARMARRALYRRASP